MFDLLAREQVRDVHFKYDPASGLKAIIAIHNTKLGPSLGGCRFIPYDSEDSALNDAIRLAKGMSYKAALAKIPQGGGKSVIIKPAHYDPERLFSAFGDFINELGGRYITAIDSGTSAQEMDIIARRTRHVTSTSHETNPSDFTAAGVFAGIATACRLVLMKPSLAGVHVALQGLGNVGFQLARKLHKAGARLTVTDIDEQRVRDAVVEFGATAVRPEAIYLTPCDVFSPCGLGGVINDESITQLNCRIVAGSANNQLQNVRHGKQLHQNNILYAPDYVINSGGLIYVSMHHNGFPDHDIVHKSEEIAFTLEEIFSTSLRQSKPTSVIADTLAEEKLYGPAGISGYGKRKSPLQTDLTNIPGDELTAGRSNSVLQVRH